MDLKGAKELKKSTLLFASSWRNTLFCLYSSSVARRITKGNQGGKRSVVYMLTVRVGPGIDTFGSPITQRAKQKAQSSLSCRS